MPRVREHTLTVNRRRLRMHLAILLIVLSVVLTCAVRLLTRQPQPCGRCGRMVTGTTVLTGGERLCKQCLMETFWASTDHAVGKIAGTGTAATRALRPKDPEVGRQCPICHSRFRVMDPVSESASGAVHVACFQIAEAYTEE